MDSSSKCDDQQDSFICTEDPFSNARQAAHHDVPILLATQENLKAFGRLVPDFYAEQVERVTWPKTMGWRSLMVDSGNKHALAEGDYDIIWKGDFVYANNVAVQMEFVTAMSASEGVDGRRVILVRDANYHPDGSQVFFTKSRRPFVMLMAPPIGDDIQPEDFTAFWFDGTHGFNIAPNVWHQAPYCVDDVTVFLNKQSSVFASVEVDTVKEFNVFLRVPICL